MNNGHRAQPCLTDKQIAEVLSLLARDHLGNVSYDHLVYAFGVALGQTPGWFDKREFARICYPGSERSSDGTGTT